MGSTLTATTVIITLTCNDMFFSVTNKNYLCYLAAVSFVRKPARCTDSATFYEVEAKKNHGVDTRP